MSDNVSDKKKVTENFNAGAFGISWIVSGLGGGILWGLGGLLLTMSLLVIVSLFIDEIVDRAYPESK